MFYIKENLNDTTSISVEINDNIETPDDTAALQ